MLAMILGNIDKSQYDLWVVFPSLHLIVTFLNKQCFVGFLQNFLSCIS